MKRFWVLAVAAAAAMTAGLVLANTMSSRITEGGIQADEQGTSGQIPADELAMLGGGALLILAAVVLAVLALVVLLRSRSGAPETSEA